MASGYRVKTVVLTSGERLPALFDREGQPMFAIKDIEIPFPSTEQQ